MKTQLRAGVVSLAATVLLSASASASTLIDRHSSFWILGDSLSAFVDVGGTTLRASDGPLWSERVIAKFQAEGKVAESLAVGGATAGGGDPTDLTGQTTALTLVPDGLLGGDPLVALWFGGNDVGAIIDGDYGPDTFQSAYSTALTTLYNDGFRDFLIFDVPDVSATPRVQFSGATPGQIGQVSGLSAALNDRLGLAVAGLPADATVTRLPFFEPSQRLWTAPEDFGALGVGPCVLRDGLNVTPIPGVDCDETTFWDDFHPTALVHEEIASRAEAAYDVAVIPLPASALLFLGGLGGLAVLRTRRG